MAHLPGVDDDALNPQDGLSGLGMTFDPNRFRMEREQGGGMNGALGMALAQLGTDKGKGSRRRVGGVWKRLAGDDLEVLYGPNVAGHQGHLHLAADKGLVRLGKKLERKGFDVGEHPAFGGVDPVHTSGSHHYSGDAIDVNYNGGGRWDSESEALRWLKRKLKRTLGDSAYYG